MLQSVLIPKSIFNLVQAKNWIKDHNYKLSFYGKKPELIDNFYHFRQQAPSKFKKYYSTKLKNGVILVNGY